MTIINGELVGEPHLTTKDSPGDFAESRGSSVMSNLKICPHAVVLELVRKDVEQHIKGVSGLMGLLALFNALASLALRNDSLNAYLTGMAGFALLGFLPWQLGQWLIGNERLQGTIRFLKMLPLQGEHVVAAKFAAAWMFIALSWFLFCFAPWIVATRIYGKSTFVSFQDLCAVCLFSGLAAALCLAIHLLFEKHAIIFLLCAFLVLVLLAWLVFTKVDFIRIYFTTSLGQSFVGHMLQWSVGVSLWLAAIVGLFRLSVRAYRRISG